MHTTTQNFNKMTHTRDNTPNTHEQIPLKFNKELGEFVPTDKALLPYFYWWAFARLTKCKNGNPLINQALAASTELEFVDWLQYNLESFKSIATDEEFQFLGSNEIVAAHDPCGNFHEEEKMHFYSRTKGEIYLRISTNWPKEQVMSALSDHLEPYYEKARQEADIMRVYLKIPNEFRSNTIKRILISHRIRLAALNESDAIQEIIKKFNIKVGAKGAANGVDEKKHQTDIARRYLRRAESILHGLSIGEFPTYV